MEKLKNSVLFRLKALNPSASINSTHASFIQDRLQHVFKSFHTPTHPPYAQMIKRAIMELKEESGSTEEAISEFIRREYEDLPLAHGTVLNVHLRKLCLDGILVCKETGRYVLLVDCDNEKDNPNQRRKRNGLHIE
uniref:Histone H1 n=2 Tax=Cajanus cajan TaxID=3821 RepID=A0A151SYJ4_CAJCA|nr:Histone H1 [Cajanus cajan]